jgi:hypothetical protein
METHPEEFKLTEEDIQRTEKQITEMDLTREQSILAELPLKLDELLKSSDMDDFTIELINNVSKLYNVIMSLPALHDDLKRRILYALDYFVDKDDEIPDEIPEFGYLDDLVIVRYVVDQIMSDNSDMFQA